jgi:hypothetical protein
VRHLTIGEVRFGRIPYGAESDDWGAEEHACHDCAQHSAGALGFVGNVSQ